MPIRKVKARQIIDSRGEPTIEVDLITDIGLLRSSVPSIIFPSPNAAKEVRDGKESVYRGRSVLKVVETINNVIAPEILKSKLDVNQQRDIDALLTAIDGTPDKSKLGLNAILGISMACCKAAAAVRGLPLYRYIASLYGNEDIYLPVPVFNVVSGGRAAGNDLVYQEFLILPTGAKSFSEAMQMGSEVFRNLEARLAEAQELKPPLGVTDVGSFAPTLEDDKEAISNLIEAITNAGYDGKVKIGLDIGASAFYKDGMYDMEFKAEEESDPEDYLDQEAMLEQYAELFTEFPQIVSVEDPFGHDDYDGFVGLKNQQPDLQIVADKLTVTNVDKVEEAVENGAVNSVIIRLTDAGTITEVLDCVKAVRDANWGVVVSVGQGETEDTFVSDLAVGISAGQLKAGGPCRSERISKYNQILRIEEELGADAKYAGEKFRNPLA